MNAAFSYLHLPAWGPCALFIHSSGPSFYDELCFSYYLNFRAEWAYSTGTFSFSEMCDSSALILTSPFVCVIILHIKVSWGCTASSHHNSSRSIKGFVFDGSHSPASYQCFKNREISLLPRVMWATHSLTKPFRPRCYVSMCWRFWRKLLYKGWKRLCSLCWFTWNIHIYESRVKPSFLTLCSLLYWFILQDRSETLTLWRTSVPGCSLCSDQISTPLELNRDSNQPPQIWGDWQNGL